MLTLIQKIENIPFDIDLTKSYVLEIHQLDQVIQHKLDMTKLYYTNRKDYKGYKLYLNKMNTKYFFSESREGLVKYIEKEKNIRMYILMDGKRVGEAEFSLDDFTTN